MQRELIHNLDLGRLFTFLNVNWFLTFSKSADCLHFQSQLIVYIIIFFLQVAQQCKENIYAIQTLKDFQYLDDNKDQGINVREKAKSLVALLKDDERLRNERVRALKAKERFAQSAAGIGSDTVVSIFLAP